MLRAFQNFFPKKILFSKGFLAFLPILIVLIGTVPVFSSLLRPGYFPMHDDMQAMRLFELDKCFHDGQIPCRWVPDMGFGYGYPQFNYYSPLPYYVMEIFHLLGLGFLDSVKAGIILGFLLSSITMFFLGKAIWGVSGGLVASFFYTYAPYRAMDVYNRGAVGEFWALIFFPAIFWSIFEFVRSEKNIYLLWLALSLGGLFLSHNISSMIFLPFVILWILILIWTQKKWFLVPKVFLGGIWGFGFAAFFILPAILEKKYAHVETMIGGYFNYLAHFLSLRQIFFSSHWGYGSSTLGPYDDVSFTVGIFHWTIALLALILAFFSKNKKVLLISLFFFLAGIISALMTQQRSVFIWNRISILVWLQFPWRFLALSIFFFSILAGGFVGVVKNKGIGIFITVFLIFLIIFLNVSFFRPSRWLNITDKDKFSGELWEKQTVISIFDYLPISAEKPPAKKAPQEPILIEGEAKFQNYKKGTDWQTVDVESLKDSKIQLPIYYFPGWTVSIDNEKTNLSYNNSLGLLTFDVPKGEHQVIARLEDTLPRRAGNIITLLSLICLLIFPAARLTKNLREKNFVS
jgi:hypothetical protein